ncbi:MAG: phenylalanine--tRNA ligase subunit alpha [Actinomycetota bacterium]|nr:phenylalanine--tRNA ligase subunit alpha [Actinomycetota bacterium]
MKENIDDLKNILDKEFEDFKSAVKKVETLSGLENIENRFLGKKSLVSEYLKNMGTLSNEFKPIAGKTINDMRRKISERLSALKEEISLLEFDKKLRNEKYDISLPGRKIKTGSKNILNQIIEEIEEFFIGLGYEIAEGPEIETDYYNFEALNHPPDHPARSLHDTFFIDENILLRTHTSPVQIRYMEKHKPPVYVIAPGKTYRKDYDVTHTPMFTQIEGLAVDKDINFGNFKWTLETFVHAIFGRDRKIRFRPHYFPFTEPSAEVDVSCNMCKGSGCRICSYSGWLEILGAGMVDPNLYKFVDYNPEEVNGFAFGIGIERIAMLKYGINDLRMFFENDLRFLNQF